MLGDNTLRFRTVGWDFCYSQNDNVESLIKCGERRQITQSGEKVRERVMGALFSVEQHKRVAGGDLTGNGSYAELR